MVDLLKMKDLSDIFASIKEEEKEENVVDIQNNSTNVVGSEKLREIQTKTLNEVADYISKTFGPMGSNTKIITGNDPKNITSSYSKDGLKVLKEIINTEPIEASIVAELVDITRHVESEVGDGTTSTVILSSLIFENLVKLQKKYSVPPFQLIRIFTHVVDNIIDIIKKNGNKCTLDDIYDIAMISTNGNVEASTDIKNIYSEFGLNVDLSLGISNSTESVIKVYDGLTITEGMSDPVFINNTIKNTSEIHNAKIYHFADPVDTMDMISLFEAILYHNIYDPLSNDEPLIPTVITCPRLSRDLSPTLKSLSESLYQFNGVGQESAKPPILIITDVVASDEVIMDDIANLCGCKSIRKYIDPKVLEKDRAAGKAPSIDNVWEFAGEAELVVADAKKTKFINPKHMRITNKDGSVEDDPKYTALVQFLETEINNAKPSDTPAEIGVLKKRLSALKANMVEYLVGGVTIAERDYIKDLLEDAIKNCKSAAKYGVGYAANYEGLRASYEYMRCIFDGIMYKDTVTDIEKDISRIIFSSYFDITTILYSTVCNDYKIIESTIENSINSFKPYNISEGYLPEKPSDNVKCSIMLDINILKTISKIITMMVTCNQCLLQSPHLNKYV